MPLSGMHIFQILVLDNALEINFSFFVVGIELMA
jgi:hypothetical protein